MNDKVSLSVLGVDMSALFRRYWEANAGTNEQGPQALKRTVEEVARLRVNHDRVAICCDESIDERGNLFRGKSFRVFIEPRYKWNREPMPASYMEQLRQTLKRLDADGYSIFHAIEVSLKSNGGPEHGYFVEADDMLASLAHWCVSEGHSLTVVSSDKDLFQLVSDEAHIVVRRLDDDVLWNEARVGSELVKAKKDGADVKIGVPPHLVVDWLALAGDGADNFEAFGGWTDPPTEGETEGKKHPGIGSVTAIKLLKEFGDLQKIIEALEKNDPRIKGHLLEVFKHGQPTPREAAERGRRLAYLMRLSHGAVDFPALLAPPQIKPLSDAVVAYFDESEAEAHRPKFEQPASLQEAIDTAVKQGLIASKEIDRSVARERYNEARLALASWCEANNLDRAETDAALVTMKGGVSAAVKIEQAQANEPAPVTVPSSSRPNAPAQQATQNITASIEAPLTIPDLMPPVPTIASSKQTSATMVVSRPTSINAYAFQPVGLKELMPLANIFANGRLFSHLGTAEAIASVIVEANERGVPAVTALRQAHVINGKVGWTAGFLAALVKNSGLVDYFELVESDWDHAVVEFKRSTGSKRVVQYKVTMEDAKRKGYDGSRHPVWQKDAQTMLVWMAYRECARKHFPEVVANMYEQDELND